MPMERNSERLNGPTPFAARNRADQDISRQPPHDAASHREQQIKDFVRSLFRHCSQSENPALAFSKASSKVGFWRGTAFAGVSSTSNPLSTSRSTRS